MEWRPSLVLYLVLFHLPLSPCRLIFPLFFCFCQEQICTANFILIITNLSLGCGKYLIVQTNDNDKEEDDVKKALQEKGSDYQEDYENDYLNDYENGYENDYRHWMPSPVPEPRRCKRCRTYIKNKSESHYRSERKQFFFARNKRLQIIDDHMERIRLQVSANNE